MTAPLLDRHALNRVLEEDFPPESRQNLGEVINAGAGSVRLKLEPRPWMVRPGELISGPTQMGMADVAAFLAVLTVAGRVTKAVTHTLTMNFLRACPIGDLYADARLLRQGRRIIVCNVHIHQGDPDRLVAQASVGYSLP
ncbi:PaaI family thioesterase [Sphingobium sp. YR768]|uniref:PaaI family thioesterase n=1 Tax=Sphingobium sp. YR768 TaxID=1884365 RepID=UPI0008B82BAB|nr:PaaI family thioesterase [Sphingobium sp. YR768]SES12660.1 uncharacterized domain 1-containing protein [Sphingobium sp. YR768]